MRHGFASFRWKRRHAGELGLNRAPASISTYLCYRRKRNGETTPLTLFDYLRVNVAIVFMANINTITMTVTMTWSDMIRTRGD